MADDEERDRLVGVYRDEETAEAAAEEARAGGARDVEVGAEGDRVASLRGEMREELEEAWAGPSVGLYTKEQARSVPLYTAVGALLGALVALPGAFFDIDGLDFGVRAAIALFSGAMAGGTIGFLVGGGFFEPRRKSRSALAAERGVVVGATPESATPETEQVDRHLITRQPMRVDKIEPDGRPAGLVAREDEEERPAD